MTPGAVGDHDVRRRHHLSGDDRVAAGHGRAGARNRARSARRQVHDLRDFTTDRHRVVDDVPYGGGPGMVLKPEPIFRALDAIEGQRGRPLSVVLTSPQGTRFTQARRAG